MALKRALVVDDSRSARMALKALLEQHGIAVEFAESGEAAIEFLKHQTVDVIFMDHTMPGMDGLEAVSLIKADPRTAVIPVMMYTAKEGEVYVGQARALGAVGVLPKQVHPGALFDMLLKLGLVREQRARQRRTSDADGPDAVPGTNEAPEPRPPGIPVQELVARIVRDQHLELRSDILASNRDLARQVAEEIQARQRADEAQRAPPPRPAGGGVFAAGLLLGLLPALVLFLMLYQAWEDRATLRADRAALLAAAEQQTATIMQLQAASLSAPDTGGPAHARGPGLLESLQWGVNQGADFGFEELPFDDLRLERLRELLGWLVTAGFSGTVRLEAHLGEFCLAEDAGGEVRLAAPGTPLGDCALFGHPLDGPNALGEAQSVAFANFLASSPLVQDVGIEVQLAVHGAGVSRPRYPYPAGLRTAGEWNRIAALNNRVEFLLLAE